MLVQTCDTLGTPIHRPILQAKIISSPEMLTNEVDAEERLVPSILFDIGLPAFAKLPLNPFQPRMRLLDLPATGRFRMWFKAELQGDLG